jgi:hypothetical protein
VSSVELRKGDAEGRQGRIEQSNCLTWAVEAEGEARGCAVAQSQLTVRNCVQGLGFGTGTNNHRGRWSTLWLAFCPLVRSVDSIGSVASRAATQPCLALFRSR